MSPPVQAGSSAGEVRIAHSLLAMVPYQVAVEVIAIPRGFDEKGRLEVVMTASGGHRALQLLQMHTGRLIKPVVAEKEIVLQMIAGNYGRQVQREGRAQAERPRASLSINPAESAVTMVNDIIHEAIRLRASDIHFEPFEREMAIRFRIDGVLQEIACIPRLRVPEVISRIKIMSRMDIAEKRRSQDGRIRINEQGSDVDIRVSTLPTDFGEKTVMRLLDKSSYDYNLDSIGMDPGRMALFKKAIQQPNGIVILTGPTGSGKTTTLYAVINYIRKPGINISTVEDPIEYNITGVNQTQVNLATGMTFAHSLRTLLRQDPDVIMVGEMRDRETAEIAIRSSLTGHLVLSTLHTNDAPSAVTRLVDMGIEPYLVSSSVSMIVAQRLVRRLCSHCKCETTVTEEIRKSLGLAAGIHLYKGLGCSACGYTGYRGRTGIYEVFPISDHIRSLINDKAYAAALRAAALDEGMILLRDHALAKLVDGVTSAEEILREISVLA
ncbi:MAG: type II/IV secretion system protein [Chitinispirillaceae bacterium]|nr:type II/IV secretion system protein [Chitinispirillaceae bacterium]